MDRLIFYYITNSSVNITNILKRNVGDILSNHIYFNFEKDIVNNNNITSSINLLKDVQKIIDIEQLLAEALSLPGGGRMDSTRGYIIPKRLNAYAGYSIYELIGRKEVLTSIHEHFQNKNIILITGLGGIGKTTIARAYIEEYKDEYSHLAYVDTTNNLAESILRRLSNIDRSFNIDYDLSALQNVEIMFNKLRTIYNTVLVIDNCNDEAELWEIKPLLEILEWKVLITSRTRPKGYQEEVIVTEALQSTEALQLFNKFYSVREDTDLNLIDTIIAKAHYHTKLIILIAKAAHNNPLLALDALADKVANNAYQDESLAHNVDLDTEERTIHEFILALFKPESLSAYLRDLL